MEHKIPECFSIIHGFINMEIHFNVPREECCTGVSRCGSGILGLRHKVGRHGCFPSMCLPGGSGASSCCNLARPGEIMDQKLHGSPTRRWLRGIQLRCWWLWPLSRPSCKDQWVQGLPDFPIKGISLETSDATPSTGPRATEQPLLDLLLGVWPFARILHFRVLVFRIQDFYSNICLQSSCERIRSPETCVEFARNVHGGAFPLPLALLLSIMETSSARSSSEEQWPEELSTCLLWPQWKEMGISVSLLLRQLNVRSKEKIDFIYLFI